MSEVEIGYTLSIFDGVKEKVVIAPKIERSIRWDEWIKISLVNFDVYEFLEGGVRAERSKNG